jgi:iron complex outermembrane recepter protein
MFRHRALARLAPGALIVVAVSTASPVRAQRVRPSPRDSVRTDSMRRQPQRLGAVTITTAPAERIAPSSATRIDAAAIRLTPATSAPDLLRLGAGVEVHEQGQGPGFASDASIRGFSSDHSSDLALWVDGVPVNEPVNGHAEGYNDWGLIFPRGIQDIDVIKGPSSPLFGNFAMSGVVNVRTLERMEGTEISATGGAFGRASATLLTGFAHEIAGTARDYSGVFGLHAVREDGFRPNARNDVLQGHARLVRDLSAGTTIDGGVELYAADWDSPGYLSQDEFALGDYRVVSNPTDGGFKRRAQERLSVKRQVSHDLLWRTTTYATEGRWQLFLTVPPAGGRFEGLGSQLEEEDRRYGVGLTSALTLTRPHGDVTLGVEGRLDDSDFQRYFSTDRRRDSTATDLTARQSLGALFLQSVTNAGSRLRVDAGLRMDALATRSTPRGDASITGSNAILSPKVGAQYTVSRAAALYGNVSRGFRSTDGVIEDPRLPLITAWAYEVGAKLDDKVRYGGVCNLGCAPRYRERTSLSAAFFRMDVSNEQTLNPATLQATSGGQSVRQGVEITVDWTPIDAARLSTEWTFTDAHYTHFVSAGEEDSPGAAPEVLDGLRVFNTSRYVGVASAGLGPRAAPWRLRISGNWVGRYAPFDQPGVLLGGYGLLHVSGFVRTGRYEWDLGIRNALDRRFPEIIAGSRVAPGQPRAAYFTARVTY